MYCFYTYGRSKPGILTVKTTYFLIFFQSPMLTFEYQAVRSFVFHCPSGLFFVVLPAANSFSGCTTGTICTPSNDFSGEFSAKKKVHHSVAFPSEKSHPDTKE